MDIKVIVALIGIGGILFAAGLSSWGYFYRSMLESKKSARRVLYLLLEIRYAIINSSFDGTIAAMKYAEHYEAKLHEKNINFKKEDLINAWGDKLTEHFNKISLELQIDIEKNLLIPFEDSLIEFSTVNPVLAYQLRGTEKLKAFIAHSNEYHKKVISDVIPTLGENWVKTCITSSAHSMKEKSLSDAMKSLNNDVLLLAKFCGRNDYNMSKEIIDKAITYNSQYDFQDMDVYIDSLIKELQAATLQHENNKPNL